ncbi:CerR family C-terminal domain-containing protein [Acetobacteraceae bacterium H6797]|nr:CerR family C-terminal domain-containing protein [Acetobacteraceae bacterium H6797]
MDRSALTRQRLLRAAADIFAERGPRGATVRAIVARANANVAAVNYHFRSKSMLYEAVLAESFQSVVKPSANLEGASLSPTQRLEQFIERTITGAMADQVRRRHARILAHELLDPTGALARLAQTDAAPHFQEALQVVAALLPPDAEEQARVFAATWLISQCLAMHHLRDSMAELTGTPLRPLPVSSLAGMVAAGLAALLPAADGSAQNSAGVSPTAHALVAAPVISVGA